MRTIILSLILIICGAMHLHSCSCVEPPPPSEAIKTADVVFVGTVVSGTLETNYQRKYEFNVKEVLKGEISSRISVLTGENDAICGYSFNIGREYLVYATIHDGKLFTNICTRTKEYNLDVKKEVEELKQKP